MSRPFGLGKVRFVVRWVAALAVVLLTVGCTGLAEGESGTREFAVVAPDDWVEVSDGSEELFALAVDHPDPEVVARLGVARVTGLHDVRGYVMDTSAMGAALRGLEPDVIREEEFEVDGAVEARLVEFTYTARVPGNPRVHALQLVVQRADDVGFDLRVEALEEQWDVAADVADRAVATFRLR